MKIKLLRIAVTVCISSFVLSACDKKHGIVILPVNNDEQKKFESHWKDVHDALNRKPEWAELYHIQDFSHGNLVGSAGKLPEILYVGEIKEAQFAVAPDFSGHAFQIGVGISKVGEGVRYLNKTDPGPDATPI